MKAVVRYNLAASFAPKGFQQFGEIYAKRGCVAFKLFVLNDYLADTSTAVRLGCSKDLKKKMKLTREADEEVFQSLVARNQSRNENYGYLAFLDRELFNIHGSVNPEYPAMASCLKVLSSDAYGKVVIVTDHVPAGTTVIVEEPFVAICVDEKPFMWEFHYCCRCFLPLMCTIPCDNCVFSVYCSQKCKTEDLKHGHKYFCKCSPYLHSVKSFNEFYLASMALCKAGPVTLYEMYLRSTWNDMDEDENTATPTGASVHGPSSVYKKVLNFEAGIELSASLLGNAIWHCVSLIKVLDLKTPFFKQVKPKDPEKFKKFVTSIFFNHMTTISSNALVWHSIHKSDVKDDTLGCPPKDSEGFGVGLFPNAGLLTNSCDPTVTRHHLINGRVAIVTNRHLFPGDEITISYASEFPHMAKDEREIILNPFLRTSCDGMPCMDNWPIYTNEMKRKTQYICQRCTKGQFKNYNRDMVLDASKYILFPDKNRGVLTCRECRLSLTLKEIQGKYWESMARAQKLIQLNKPLTTIKILLECTEYFQRVLYPPSHEFIKCTALLNEAYTRIIIEAAE